MDNRDLSEILGEAVKSWTPASGCGVGTAPLRGSQPWAFKRGVSDLAADPPHLASEDI
jgi:hypothetical protein